MVFIFYLLESFDDIFVGRLDGGWLDYFGVIKVCDYDGNNFYL
jgi:hypothetical protein